MGDQEKKSTSYQEYLNEKLKDPGFSKAWEDEQIEIKLSLAIMEARDELGLTQEELAEAIGMKQNVISRLERGAANPTVHTLKRIAEGLNKELVINFC